MPVNPKLEAWLSMLNPRTAFEYRRSMRRIVPEEKIDAFLTMPKPAQVEIIQTYLKQAKERELAGDTIRLHLAVLKSFVSYYHELEDTPNNLPWNIFRKQHEKALRVSTDRLMTSEEIAKLLRLADPRFKAAILIMLSSGIRIGGLCTLKLGDYERIEYNGKSFGCLTVYKGEPEQYYAFISTEARTALEEYLGLRKLHGEELKPESPLIRDDYNPQWPNSVNNVSPIGSASFSNILMAKWRISGVRTGEKSKRNRFDFKCAHGFRSWFRSNLRNVSQDDCEILLGHIKFSNYYRPTKEHLIQVYAGSMDSLTVTESGLAKQALTSERAGFQESIELISNITKALILSNKDAYIANLNPEQRAKLLEILRLENEIGPDLVESRKQALAQSRLIE